MCASTLPRRRNRSIACHAVAAVAAVLSPFASRERALPKFTIRNDLRSAPALPGTGEETCGPAGPTFNCAARRTVARIPVAPGKSARQIRRDNILLCLLCMATFLGIAQGEGLVLDAGVPEMSSLRFHFVGWSSVHSTPLVLDSESVVSAWRQVFLCGRMLSLTPRSLSACYRLLRVFTLADWF